MKLGSLFDGIAGFPLAAVRHGIEPVWASEIETFPISVSKRHFPNMKHLGSVTDIGLCIDTRGPEVEWYFSDSQGDPVENTDVDIVSFGSPCQDSSVAGKRAGLSGRRSNLFYQAVRVIRDIQDATAGKSPRFVLWENVTGAFSSNGGQDFAAVIESLVGAAVSVPEKGWPGAGVVFGPKGQLAYRTFDAQYWGVPQRRRRIFALMHFAGERAGEILFVEPSLPWDSQESREAREATAAGAGDGVDRGQNVVGVPQLYDMTHADEVMRPVEPGKCPTLNARMGTGGNQVPVLMEPIAIGFNGDQSEKTRSMGEAVEQCPTLRAGGATHVAHPIAGDKAGALAAEPSKADKPSSTTYVIQSATMGGSKKQNGLGVSDGPCYTLDCRANHAVAHAVDVRNLCENEELSSTLQCKATGGYSLNYQNPVRIGYAVRRLTPTECLRLMGFPDDWFDGIPGNSDTACYKACGNSVAIPCVEFIMRRIVECASS